MACEPSVTDRGVGIEIGSMEPLQGKFFIQCDSRRQGIRGGLDVVVAEKDGFCVRHGKNACKKFTAEAEPGAGALDIPREDSLEHFLTSIDFSSGEAAVPGRSLGLRIPKKFEVLEAPVAAGILAENFYDSLHFTWEEYVVGVEQADNLAAASGEAGVKGRCLTAVLLSNQPHLIAKGLCDLQGVVG